MDESKVEESPADLIFNKDERPSLTFENQDSTE
jgi:hypothetical protein